MPDSTARRHSSGCSRLRSHPLIAAAAFGANAAAILPLEPYVKLLRMHAEMCPQRAYGLLKSIPSPSNPPEASMG